MSTQDERIAKLQADIADRLAALQAKKKGDEGALIKPPGKYRIIRLELPRGERGQPDPRPDGFYVQNWGVSSHGYDGRGHYEIGSLGAERALMDRLAHLNGLTPMSYIEWRDLGPANPFSTHELAAEWLRKFVRPVVAEAHFGADGEPIPAAQSQSVAK